MTRADASLRGRPAATAQALAAALPLAAAAAVF